MRPQTIQIFFMQPPPGAQAAEKRKENLLGEMLKRAMEISSKVQGVSDNIKQLPHTQHPGGS